MFCMQHKTQTALPLTVIAMTTAERRSGSRRVVVAAARQDGVSPLPDGEEAPGLMKLLVLVGPPESSVS